MRLYNSLTRTKEKFIPLDPEGVKMYVCGITPYDTTHLGHAFTYVFFDALWRYLEFRGYKVIYTQNVTDVDDDILKRAKEEGKNWRKLGEYWTQVFLGDMETLNVRLPTHYVRATDSIDTMIQIIKALLEEGFAYLADGNVYFEVKKFRRYGKLSNFNKNQMLLISRERGGNPDDPLKRDPLDFVLWQRSLPNEPSWGSPFGRGRPGWHIECSAMIRNTLGEQIDIHGGGKDLIFPHHESEIAQSEAYTGKKPFVRYWLHTAMVLCDGEKMSKSLGNLVMIRDLFKKYSANSIRWVLLSHHYRVPWEFDEAEFAQATEYFNFILRALGVKSRAKQKLDGSRYLKIFTDYMGDDLNTSLVLRLVVRLAKRILREEKRAKVEDFQKTLRVILGTLGFRVDK